MKNSDTYRKECEEDDRKFIESMTSGEWFSSLRWRTMPDVETASPQFDYGNGELDFNNGGEEGSRGRFDVSGTDYNVIP